MRLMGAGRWAEIKYSAVPAICMKLCKILFAEHDEVRFSAYLEKVAKGEAKINVGALQPHDLIKSAQETDGSVAMLQWAALVEQVRSHAQLQDCIAVCDVSGSMETLAAPGVSCMDVAMALSLLICAALASWAVPPNRLPTGLRR